MEELKLKSYRVSYKPKESIEERQKWFRSESRETVKADFEKAFPELIFVKAV